MISSGYLLGRRDWQRPWRRLWRLPALLVHLVLMLPLVVVLVLLNPVTARLRPGGERLDHVAIRLWSAALVRIFGLRVRRFGHPLPGAVLLVANHVSWLDIELVHSQCVASFVAKAEIARWPLIGWIVGRAGTIYHSRGSGDSLHGVMHLMRKRLQSGHSVAVFPEGRATRGEAVEKFHARIFQPAVLAGVPAQPVALRYGHGGDAQTVVAFAPGETMVSNFLRLLGEPGRAAEIHFLEPVIADEGGRRRMAELCRARIVAAMARPE